MKSGGSWDHVFYCLRSGSRLAGSIGSGSASTEYCQNEYTQNDGLYGTHSEAYSRPHWWEGYPPTNELFRLLREQHFQLLLDIIHGRLYFSAVGENFTQVRVKDGHHLVPLGRERQREGDIGRFA